MAGGHFVHVKEFVTLEYVFDGHSSQSPFVSFANLKPSGQDVHDTEPGPDI